MQALTRWLLSLALVTFLATQTRAQQPLPDGSGDPISSANPAVPTRPPAPSSPRNGLYRDLDLLRRTGFSEASQASVSLRILDPSGLTPPHLTSADFQLLVNGTLRSARVHAPGSSGLAVPPMVLLVLPPNQPVVHSIAVRNAEKYFAAQPSELLPWKVGIFDANGKMTPFTNGRSQLLANLDVVEHAKEPFEYAGNAGLPAGYQWDGSWLLKAEDAIGMMQRFDGPKVVLAINPLATSDFGLNSQSFAHDGPESLTGIAKTIGAHIYIANVGGPEVYIPGGGAADDHPAQINTLGGPRLGTLPSYHQQVDPEMTAAMNYYAYRTSMMMQTAQDTLGGFSNSLSELAGKIHSDLDGNYLLDFDLTPEDTDKGVPSIEVRMVRRDLRVAILDLVPIGSSAQATRQTVSHELMEAIRKATQVPISSPDYRVLQHVDYFPLHQGLEPVLPMSGLVEWTGQGKPPRQLFVVESVEDPNLSSVILERAVEARWNGRSLSWERDGQLRPGNYLWRVAVHDGTGKVFASATQKIAIPFPRSEPVAVSSLVVGKGCREGEPASGLATRPVKSPANPAGDQGLANPASQAGAQGLAHLLIDPMRAGDCRVKPEAVAEFDTTDTLHAFVRIYPGERLDKRKPESWTAKFVLRGAQPGGLPSTVALERQIPFTSDSGSGYLASIVVPLGDAAVAAGDYTLEVEMRGSGVHGSLKASRALSIVAPALRSRGLQQP